MTKHYHKYAVGLLGGSFNPAHNGHLYISNIARKKLNLKQIWWLIDPHNPLKQQDKLSNYKTRLQSAQLIINSPNPKSYLKICQIQYKKQLKYSHQTITYLQTQYPNIQFVWLMGADCWHQFRQWKQWKKICSQIPIAIFQRQPHSIKITKNIHSKNMQKLRLPIRKAKRLKNQKNNKWIYLPCKKYNISSTQLRQNQDT